MDFFKNKKNVYIFIAVIVVIMCIIICFYMEKSSSNSYSETSENNEIISETKEKVVETKKIIIHVAGEVKNPGIIECDKGSRIIDVVNQAGGFTDEADLEKVNLAYEVQDKQKIVIPNINDKEQFTSVIDDSKSFVFQDGNGRRRY